MPKNIRRTPHIIKGEDFVLVLKTLESPGFYPPTFIGEYNMMRDKTIITTMFYCGLRPRECLDLKWDDIDFEQGTIRISPYSNKERSDIPAIVTEPAKKFLVEYRDSLQKFGIASPFVFPSIITGLPLSTDSFARRFQRIVQEAGISKFESYDDNGRARYTLNPYSLRHSFCTKVYKKTGSEEAVTQLARHKNPLSAHVYIHLDTDDKRELARKVF